MYIYLDESGNFTGNKDNYFVVGGFVTSNPRRTSKAFRKWQHTKFINKKLKYRSEFKFSDTRLTEKLRLKTLEYFSKQDIRIFYSFLNTKNIPLEFRKKSCIESGFLYAEIVAQTIHMLLPTSELEFRIFRDERQLKSLPQKEFNRTLRLDLLPHLSKNALVEVVSLDSTANVNIQIADWVCGALYRYHNNKGQNGNKYFFTLRNNIVFSKELFDSYWEKLFNNKKSLPSIRE